MGSTVTCSMSGLVRIRCAPAISVRRSAYLPPPPRTTQKQQRRIEYGRAESCGPYLGCACERPAKPIRSCRSAYGVSPSMVAILRPGQAHCATTAWSLPSWSWASACGGRENTAGLQNHKAVWWRPVEKTQEIQYVQNHKAVWWRPVEKTQEIQYVQNHKAVWWRPVE
eukprot:SAG11_NODE_4463_length_1886_cov_4.577504_2_plen_167_part_01